MSTQYGIWVTMMHWSCENGGDDITGTKEEIERTIRQWINSNGGHRPDVKYEARPYKKIENR